MQAQFKNGWFSNFLDTNWCSKKVMRAVGVPRMTSTECEDVVNGPHVLCRSRRRCCVAAPTIPPPRDGNRVHGGRTAASCRIRRGSTCASEWQSMPCAGEAATNSNPILLPTERRWRLPCILRHRDSILREARHSKHRVAPTR